MTTGAVAAISTAVLLTYCLSLIPLRWQRRGGLVFFRVGSLAGSFCFTRKMEG